MLLGWGAVGEKRLFLDMKFVQHPKVSLIRAGVLGGILGCFTLHSRGSLSLYGQGFGINNLIRTISTALALDPKSLVNPSTCTLTGAPSPHAPTHNSTHTDLGLPQISRVKAGWLSQPRSYMKTWP